MGPLGLRQIKSVRFDPLGQVVERYSWKYPHV